MTRMNARLRRNPGCLLLAAAVIFAGHADGQAADASATLRQQEVVIAGTGEQAPGGAAANSQVEPATESRSVRRYEDGDSPEEEAEVVNRLHNLLDNYYTEQQESAAILPSKEEIAAREAAQQDASSARQITFNVDKVLLSGTEGGLALAQITRRLTDPLIPESRRDIAPICLIKTRLFDTLVSSENRSLTPVGKNHYVARVRIQPGDTTLIIMSKQWELRLPQHANARDHLVTLYQPVEGEAELHVFAIEDLLAGEDAHIPAWLPEELDIPPRSG